PVAHTLVGEPGAGYACRLDGIVTTVDALHGLVQLDAQDEAEKQVALADRIHLTKTDLVDGAQADRVEQRVRALNAGADIRRGGALAAGDLFDLGPAADRVGRWLQDGHDHDDGFHHDHGIATLTLAHDRPIPWPALQRWLDSVLSIRGAQVLRLKGLVRL